MLRPILASLSILALLAAAPARAADDTYTIKLYQEKKGDRSEHESTMTSTNKIVFTVQGKENKIDDTSSEKKSYSEEILEMKEGDKKPTKLRRTYTAAEKTVNDKTTKEIFAGETLLIEKKGDKFEFELKGKALKEDEAKDLFKSFNKKSDSTNEKDLLPKDPVKLGVEWKVPMDVLERYFKAGDGKSFNVDLKKSSITGKLIKAYKKEGSQFGIIELTFTGILTEGSNFNQLGKVKAGSKMVIKGTMDTCIDGTSRFMDSKANSTIELFTELPDKGTFQMTGTSTDISSDRASKK